jgi:hypothetical protein
VVEISINVGQHKVLISKELLKFPMVTVPSSSGKTVQDYLILKLKALQYFEKSGAIQMTRHNILEDLTVQHMKH